MFEWLLELNAWKRFEAILKAGVSLTDKQIETCIPRAQSSESDPRILTKADDKAEILVEGILTERFNFEAFLFGGGNTTYEDIRASLALADQDENVREATMLINGSPGGEVAGLFDTIAAIKKFSKPLKTVVRNEAASAAYVLAAVTDSIEAVNVSDSFGSIGIVADVKVDENTVTITSKKAPKKAPDVTTEAGKKTVQERLDGYHTLLVDAIAEGRGVSAKEVNNNFGRGGMLLAEEALKNNMIDKIQSKVVKSKIKPRNISGRKEAKMDVKELKSEHPALYAEVLGLGVVDGITKERDRACAHLVYGQTSGAMDTAIKAVKEGTEMTQTLQAEYMTAVRNNADTTNRQADDAAVAAAADGAASASEEDKDEVVANAILEKAAAGCNVEIDLQKK